MTVSRPRAVTSADAPVGAASALAAAHAVQTGSADRTTTRASRRIAADPTSTALLLAGPTAMDLWPGVRRIGDSGGRVLVQAELAEAELSEAAVRALPPRRTPTSFVTRFEWAGRGLPLTAGELTLAYAPGGDGNPSTFAVLELVSAGVEASRLTACELQSMAEAFLANLADAAERRSSAA